jgi:ATP-dependent Lon protease
MYEVKKNKSSDSDSDDESETDSNFETVSESSSDEEKLEKTKKNKDTDKKTITKNKNEKSKESAKESAAAAAAVAATKKKSSKKSHRSARKKVVVSSSSEDDDSNGDDEEDESDDSDYDPESASSIPYNIIIAPGIADYFGGGGGGGEDYDEFEDYDENQIHNEEYTSEDERTFMKESYKATKTAAAAAAAADPTDAAAAAAVVSTTTAKPVVRHDIREEYEELVELKKQLTDKLIIRPNNKVLQNAIKDCDRSIKKLVKNTRNQNTSQYIKLVKKGVSDKSSEIEFFKKKLSNKEQLKVMDELTEINNYIFVEKPYRLALLESQIPARFKAIAYQKLNVLKNMNPGDNEYYKIKNWVDAFMRIPFSVYRSLNVSLTDGLDVCHNFISTAKQTLDECVYGHEDAKMQILQMAGQWISNPTSLGTAIAIKGPPGVGKTLLIKDGISKIFGREFAFMPLGGATDSSYLEGHSYTYEGSNWGRIVQILIEGKTMNPVIFFDELDKVSDTPRGEEIINILMHLTDSTQNTQFHDKYFAELDFDMSKCLFVFSYNDESKISPILRDRMYVINTKGYEVKDKLVIARKHLLPKIREQVNFNEEDVIVPDDVIQYIASSAEMTKNEEGVRNLKRCLEIIYTKLNLCRLLKTDSVLIKKDFNGLDIQFPYTVTKKTVDVLVKNTDKNTNQSMLAMYV